LDSQDFWKTSGADRARAGTDVERAHFFLLKPEGPAAALAGPHKTVIDPFLQR
jgi:hypothetical protein